MARVDAAGWLQKWSTNLNGAGTYIKNGVQRVQTAPGQSAAAASDRMLAGVTNAVSSGRWAKAVSGVSLAQWQDAMVNKGIPRLQQGTAQAVKTKGDKIAALLSNVDAATASIQSLPKGGLQQGIQRATAYMTKMSQLSGKS
jgi:hypothetical protein